ncbi:MAG TPA: hypothetical protein QKA14_01745 [Candidatus Megaira endosymbiont of Hartmannula sinica]|nr:hypothetical protein [Candidatus Megaera endosymbiont of Hartmannula sinica]
MAIFNESSLSINKIKFLIQLSSFAYDDFNQVKIQEFSFLGKKYDFLTSTDELKSNFSKYKAFAIINHELKHVIISNCGTNIVNPHDVYDDMLIYLGKSPSKQDEIEDFIENIILKKISHQVLFNKSFGDNTSENIQDYSFTTVGHSLGGVLSNIAGLHLYNKNFNVDNIFQFDSPGSYNIINNIIDNELISKDSSIINLNLQEFSNKVIGFNNNPSIINTTNKHLGTQFLIVAHNCNVDNSYDDGCLCSSIPITIYKFFSGMLQLFTDIPQDIKKHSIELMLTNILKEDAIIKKMSIWGNENGDVAMQSLSSINIEFKEYINLNKTLSYKELSFEDGTKFSEGQLYRFIITKYEQEKSNQLNNDLGLTIEESPLLSIDQLDNANLLINDTHSTYSTMDEYAAL